MTHEEMMLLPASKDRAILAGVEYYFTAKPCKRGHFSHRYTSSANCVQCIADRRCKPEILTRGKPKASVENQRRAKDALKNGFLVYHPDMPCKRGHFKRYVNSHNCVDCCSVNQKKDTQKRWRRIERIYGISKIVFFEMLVSQNGQCAICLEIICEKSCHIDHCHKKNRVRGLLCQKCNQAIGLFKDNTKTMMTAIKYIEGKK